MHFGGGGAQEATPFSRLVVCQDRRVDRSAVAGIAGDGREAGCRDQPRPCVASARSFWLECGRDRGPFDLRASDA